MKELKELMKGMTVNNSKKPSPLYKIITALAIYHLLTTIGFAITSFITMENQFVNISFYDWSVGARAVYMCGYVYIIVILLSILIKDK